MILRGAAEHCRSLWLSILILLLLQYLDVDSWGLPMRAESSKQRCPALWLLLLLITIVRKNANRNLGNNRLCYHYLLSRRTLAQKTTKIQVAKKTDLRPLLKLAGCQFTRQKPFDLWSDFFFVSVTQKFLIRKKIYLFGMAWICGIATVL